MRLETLGALSAFSAALLAVEQAGSASSTGLSLSYALQITLLTNMTVRLASLAENAFNAVGAWGVAAHLWCSRGFVRCWRHVLLSYAQQTVQMTNMTFSLASLAVHLFSAVGVRPAATLAGNALSCSILPASPEM